MYSTVIKYWDYLRQVDHDFKESNRQMSDITGFLNDPRIAVGETIQDLYFEAALSELVNQLQQDINSL